MIREGHNLSHLILQVCYSLFKVFMPIPVRSAPFRSVPLVTRVNISAKYHGKYPPGVGKSKLFQKQGRNKSQHEKGKPQIFPVFGRFQRFAPIEIGFNDFGHFSVLETGKK